MVDYTLSDDSQLHMAGYIAGEIRAHTWAKNTEWLTITVKPAQQPETNCQRLTSSLSEAEENLSVDTCSANKKSWKWQCLYTVQKTRGWEMWPKLGVRRTKERRKWRVIEVSYKMDKDTDKERKTGILMASYESVRACARMCLSELAGPPHPV